MNDVTIRGNYDVVALNSLVNDIAGVQQSMTTTSAEPYLRMGKDGIWIYGPESLEIEKASEWAIHPLSVSHGYVCWEKNDDQTKANSKLGEVMVAAGKPKPVVTTLPDYGYPWQEQVSFLLACVKGPDKGQQVKYSAASVGGMNEIKKLLGSMAQRIAAEQQRGGGSLSPETSEIVPIVNLDHSHYIHKKHGKIYTPVMQIIRWGTLNGGPEPANAAPKPTPNAPADEAADAPRRRRMRA